MTEDLLGQAQFGNVHPLLDVAIVFFLAILAARVAERIKVLPKVTAYLIVGLLLGPSGVGLLIGDVYDSLLLIEEVALGLILFLVGTEFSVRTIKTVGRRVLAISLCEILLTFVLVSVSCLLLYKGVTGGERISAALLLGIIATATAPAATLVVMRQYASEGPMTDNITVLVGFNNLFALIAFQLILPITIVLAGAPVEYDWALFTRPVLEILGAVVTGGCIGLVLGYGELKEEKETTRILLTLGAILIGVGLSKMYGFPMLLTAFVTGMVYVNCSVRDGELRSLLRRIELPFYVVLFVMAGAGLHISNFKTVGWLGLAYILCRLAGKYFGARLGCAIRKTRWEVRHWISWSILSHSAVAIGLVTVLSQRTNFSTAITSVVLSSVVIFELIGPIMVRHCIVESGEVSIANALVHKEVRGKESAAVAVIKKFLRSLGVLPQRTTPATLKEIMIADTSAITGSASFSKVNKFIEHSHFDSFPVIDSEGFYKGLISFNDVKTASFDPLIDQLITAGDLVTSDISVDVDADDIDSAFEKTQQANTSFLPVTRSSADKKRMLLGMVAQRDLVTAHLDRRS